VTEETVNVREQVRVQPMKAWSALRQQLRARGAQSSSELSKAKSNKAPLPQKSLTANIVSRAAFFKQEN
jgi:hypothetical protein